MLPNIVKDNSFIIGPVSLEQARTAKAVAKKDPRFQYPIVNAIGITRTSEDKHAVCIDFIGDKPEEVLPQYIEGVEIVYRFNVGEIVLASSEEE